jgi:uncharacterized protein (DUF2141 family)
MKKKSISLAVLIALCLCILKSNAQNNEVKVKLKISNIRKSKGTIRLGLFKNDDEFQKEKPFKSVYISKENIENKNLISLVNLPVGTYGISILDDENDNFKMDYNMISMPKEGFGFANYYHTGLTKPKLSEFVITINNDSKELTCKIRYI